MVSIPVKEEKKITDGLYKLKFIKSGYPEDREGNRVVFKFGPAIKFTFEVVEGEFKGSLADTLISDDWLPGRKLDRWAKILGAKPVMGSDFELDDLAGTECMGNVVSTVVNERPRNTVKEIFPLTGVVVKQTQPVQQPQTQPVQQPQTQPVQQPQTQPVQQPQTQPVKQATQQTTIKPAPGKIRF